MTTYTRTRSNPRGGTWLVLAMLLSIAFGIHYGTHAEERHGEYAWTARAAVQCQPKYQEYDDHTTGCVACCAEMEDGKVAISIFARVEDGWNEVTSFVSKNWKYVQHMMKTGRWAVR